MNNTAVTLRSELFPFISGVRRVVNSPSVFRYHPAAKLLLVVGGMSKKKHQHTPLGIGCRGVWKLLQVTSRCKRLGQAGKNVHFDVPSGKQTAIENGDL
jgi:hypothetical protein